jgi:hypothetical protein
VVDWLLRYDIGEVIKTIVDDEKFSEYALPKNPPREKSRGERRGAVEQNRTGDLEL